MLDILGSEKRTCDGNSRRDFLKAGTLGIGGLTLADAFRIQEAQATGEHPTRGFGKAKQCILLYLYGAASQHETFDMKPDAPAGIRPIFNPIETNVSGIRICEHLPRIARQMHRLTLIRSMTHPFPIHNAGYALTG